MVYFTTYPQVGRIALKIKARPEWNETKTTVMEGGIYTIFGIFRRNQAAAGFFIP